MLCSNKSLKLKAAVSEQYLHSLYYLSSIYGMKTPLMKGLRADYDGILAVTHQKRVLVYYSNKALSNINPT